MARKNSKSKVCVTYMAKGGRLTVCKKMTKRQIAKLIGWPKNLKGWKVSHF